MKKVKSLASIAIAVVAIMFVAAAPSEAREGGHGHAGAIAAPRDAGHGHARAEAHRGFEGRHDFDRDHHPRAFIGVGPSFYWGSGYEYDYAPAYAYTPPSPSYWYYCPSYGAYYPNVASCPEAWVPVLAQ